MAFYDFHCDQCDKDFEVVKSIKEYTGKENCPTCGRAGQRIFSCKIEFLGTKIEDAEFNPGLGQITKSKKHRDEIAKRLGAIEIGNENPEKIHNHFDKQREEKRIRSWEDV